MTDRASAPVVFLAFANHDDDHLPLLKKESREVMRALRELDRKGHIRVHREESAEASEIFEALSAFHNQVAIFHYGGHANKSALRLEDVTADSSGIAGLLGDQATLQLVFLNGCGTRPQVEALLDAGVSAVIATSVSIRDDKATEFAIRFYQALGNRRTIQQAFRLAEDYLVATYHDERGPGTVPLRDLPAAVADPAGETLPWALYVANDRKEEVLGWRLPSYRTVGLPSELREYIGTSFVANRYVVLTLDEMARYNPDIYDQMTEMRDGVRVRRDSRVYPELVIRNLPWPIGSQIRLLQVYDAADPARLEHLLSTYLRTTHLLHAITLSDLWQACRDGRMSVPDGLATGHPMTRETFATFDFLDATASIVHAMLGQDVLPYIAEMERLTEQWRDPSAPIRAAHAFLEGLRIRESRGAVDLDTEGYATAEEAVARLLLDTAFLCRYRMLTVRGIGVQAPRFDAVTYDLDMGPLNVPDGSSLGLYQDSSHRRKPAHANSSSVVLVRDEDLIEGALNLSPFVMDKNTFVLGRAGHATNRDRLAHLFMLAYEEGDRVVYHSVDHSLQGALTDPKDQVHTGMTEADFAEGRNVRAAAPGGAFGLNARFGVSTTAGTVERREVFRQLADQYAGREVFGQLADQYAGFKADVVGGG